MATRKVRKLKPRKRTVRGHRSSVAGKIMPPVDVRSTKHLKDFEKRIKAGPLTIVLVYADWCPHCHTMMPHFDAAAKSANRSIQAVKVNETMLPAVNSVVNGRINKSAKPLNVEGYPSIILVNNKGEKVTDIEPVRNTETMKKVMENAGPLANEAGPLENEAEPLENVKPMKNNVNNAMAMTANASKNIDIGEEELKGSIVATNNKKANVSMNSNTKNNATKNNMVNMQKMPKDIDINEPIDVPEEAISFSATQNAVKPSKNLGENVEEITSVIAPIAPPSISSDMEAETATNKVTGGGRGGSLYASLARTAYTLAPAAALLATATMVIKDKKSKRKGTIGKKAKGVFKRRITKKERKSSMRRRK